MRLKREIELMFFISWLTRLINVFPLPRAVVDAEKLIAQIRPNLAEP